MFRVSFCHHVAQVHHNVGITFQYHDEGTTSLHWCRSKKKLVHSGGPAVGTAWVHSQWGAVLGASICVVCGSRTSNGMYFGDWVPYLYQRGWGIRIGWMWLYMAVLRQTVFRRLDTLLVSEGGVSILGGDVDGGVVHKCCMTINLGPYTATCPGLSMHLCILRIPHSSSLLLHIARLQNHCDIVFIS